MPVESDQAEQQEARRNGVVGEFRGHQRGEIERDLGVELAFAVLALAEFDGNSAMRSQPRAGRQDVEQDLEPLRRHCRRQRLERVAPNHEIAAHRVGHVDAEQAPHQRIRPSAERARCRAIAGGGPPRNPGSPPRDRRRPSRNASSMVTSSISSCCKSASMMAMKRAWRASMPSRQAPARPRRPMRRMQRTRLSASPMARGDGCGAIGRIVVDEHHLPIAGDESPLQPLHQDRHVGALVERRHHDAQFRRRPRRRKRSRFGRRIATMSCITSRRRRNPRDSFQTAELPARTPPKPWRHGKLLPDKPEVRASGTTAGINLGAPCPDSAQNGLAMVCDHSL